MQKKIKILFVITQSEIGGAQKFLNTLIPNLNKSKFEVMLVAGDEGSREGFEQMDTPLKKLRHAKRNISPVHDIFVVFELRTIIKKFRPDILFLNSSKTSVWGPLAALWIRPKTKIIYRIGGWSFNDPRSEIGKKFWIFLEKIFAPFKDYIIVNNQHDLDQAKDLRIQPKKEIRLVYNGIDIDKLDFFPKKKAREELRLDPNNYIIGTIANFYKTKGLEYLIEAMKDIDNKKLVVIGDGEERGNIERLIRKNNLGQKVTLLGKRKNAYRYLKAFDAFALPSVKEGFPWVVLEAIAAQVPVIATNVGAVPEIIENGINGLIIEPKEPRQIVEALNKIESLNLTNNAYKTVTEKFNLSRMIREIEDLLVS